MVQERANHFADATPLPEIEALLSISQSLSIVDRLMAMPRVAETDRDNEWNRAVSNRLEVKVTGMMRACLEGNLDRHAA